MPELVVKAKWEVDGGEENGKRVLHRVEVATREVACPAASRVVGQ